MYCPNCGTSNLDNASLCVQCGRPLSAAAAPPPPPRMEAYTPPPPPHYAPGAPVPSYLLQSILVTLCCCLPIGIVAIVFAAQVGSRQAAGDYAGALQASRNARRFCWIGFALGILINVVAGLFYGLAGALEGFRHAVGG